ncbi:MAG: hypothetical protein ACFFCI_02320 [Promethearchaeota archaeon]
MKRYIVTLIDQITYSKVIEAETLEEAKKLAKDVKFDDRDITDVEGVSFEVEEE